MKDPDLPDIPQLIAQAQEGQKGALDALFRRFRPGLRKQAQARLGPALRQRVDASDIVQQTLLQAHRGLPEFQGHTIEELGAWLQSILLRNIGAAVRQNALAQRRAVGRERSLEDRDGAGATVGERLVSPLTSPTGRLQRGQTAAQLLLALSHLPPDQREAVRLRHVEGRSLEEIASQLGKTRAAAASLIKRGMESLRRIFPGEGLE